mmetsp:Transcript_87029/g.158967  ORF Transcript_87029/g.158967 Transcript_87029/m.158967 type:complete len:223 (-) Transcript_87029:231-899(-)
MSSKDFSSRVRLALGTAASTAAAAAAADSAAARLAFRICACALCCDFVSFGTVGVISSALAVLAGAAVLEERRWPLRGVTESLEESAVFLRCTSSAPDATDRVLSFADLRDSEAGSDAVAVPGLVDFRAGSMVDAVPGFPVDAEPGLPVDADPGFAFLDPRTAVLGFADFREFTEGSTCADCDELPGLLIFLGCSGAGSGAATSSSSSASLFVTLITATASL